MGKKAEKRVLSPSAKQTSPETSVMAAAATPVIAFYSDRVGLQYREFSNFYRHAQPFEYVLPDFAQRDGFPSSVWCAFSEKAIMATKAALMGDLSVFKEIQAVDNPKDCKSLGRKVRGFDDKLWNLHLEEVAFEVIRQKFASEKHLREVLMSTGRAILAEAAPNDKVWGIGLSVSDSRAQDPAQWNGRNILGHALMRAREHFKSNIPGVIASQASSACAVAKVAETVESVSTPVSQQVLPLACSGEPGAANQSRGTRRWGKTQAAEQTSHAAAQPNATSSRASAKVPDASLPACAAALDASADDLVFDCFAVLDFEATCDDTCQPEPQEIIEFPIVLVHAGSGRPLSEFRTYVRPLHHPQLTAFCTELTGITQESVDAAPDWSQAVVEAELWLDTQLQEFNLKRCVFVTCGDWDLASMMGRQCGLAGMHVPARFRQWLNIKNLFRKVTGKSGGGMKAMLSTLSLPLEGHHHSGLDDSRNIGHILTDLLRKGGVIEMDLVSSSSGSQAAGNSGKKGRGKGGNKR